VVIFVIANSRRLWKELETDCKGAVDAIKALAERVAHQEIVPISSSSYAVQRNIPCLTNNLRQNRPSTKDI
jgi:hypothetical protein